MISDMPYYHTMSRIWELQAFKDRLLLAQPALDNIMHLNYRMYIRIANMIKICKNATNLCTYVLKRCRTYQREADQKDVLPEHTSVDNKTPQRRQMLTAHKLEHWRPVVIKLLSLKTTVLALRRRAAISVCVFINYSQCVRNDL